MGYLTRFQAMVALAFSAGMMSSLPAYTQQQPINRVVDNLQRGQPVIGSFTRAPGAELDFAVIDQQYGEFDITAVSEALRRMGADNGPPSVAPIVRTPLVARDNPQAVVEQLLNAGVVGLMFPDIETRAQAIISIASMRFAQEGAGLDAESPGLRGTGSGTAPDYWGLNDEDYRASADVWPLNPTGELIAMIQIESPAAIENLDEILAVPGVGVIFLGPTDIASAIGEEGPNAPAVEILVQQVLRACLASNIPCGYPIVASSREDAERQTAKRLAEGFKVLAVMTREP